MPTESPTNATLSTSQANPSPLHAAMTAAVIVQAKASFLEVTDSLFVVLDREGRVAAMNRKTRAFLGFQRDEGVGIDWMEHCVPAESRGQLRTVFAALVANRGDAFASVQTPIVTATGGQRLIAWNNKLLRDDEGEVIGTISSGTDITDGFTTSAALESSQRQLSDMKDALDQAAIVGITDVRGKITYVNDKFCEISGYDRASLLGEDHRIVNSGHHSKAFIRELWHTIVTGRVWRGELYNRRKDGSHYWVDTTIVPFLDATGRPYQYVSIRTDITDRKRTEKALRESTAMARLGEMASVVAHEVKNPLAGIGGALQVIVRRMDANSPEHGIIGDILKRIELLNDTMEDLLDYARPRNLRIGRTGIERLLQQVREQVRADPRFIQVRIEIEADGSTGARPERDRPNPLCASLDARHVTAALLNLTLNAAQAMQGKGCILLAAKRAGDHLVITVSDDGPGIPKELRDRIFEPFFTTRHQGTGLGLAIVRQTAERHGGTATLRCPTEGGTVVTFSVPLKCED